MTVNVDYDSTADVRYEQCRLPFQLGIARSRCMKFHRIKDKATFGDLGKFGASYHAEIE